MKHIVIGLSTTLLVLTNSGYAQNLDASPSLEAQLHKAEADARKLAPDMSRKPISEILNALKDTNNKVNAEVRAQGGFDSGGGTLVRSSQGAGLLDLYLYNRDAFLSSKAGSSLPETRSYKKFGFDYLQRKDIAIFPQLLKQIDKWSTSSPIMTKFIREQVSQLPVYITSYRLGFKDQGSFIPEGTNLTPGSTRLAASYINNLGVFIEKKSFDQLSETNQMALLIHESLRHAQITWGSGMSNENLQKITAMILREPEPGMTLDQVSFMEGEVLDVVLTEIEAFDLNYQAALEICSLHSEYCHLVSEPLPPTDSDLDEAQRELSARKDLYLSMIAESNKLLQTVVDEKSRASIRRSRRIFVDAFRILQIRSLQVLNENTRKSVKIKSGEYYFLWQLMQGDLDSYNREGGFLSDSAMRLNKVENFMIANGYFKKQ